MQSYNTQVLVVYFSTNNILFNITDLHGNSLNFSTTGMFKTKGAKKTSLTSLKMLFTALTPLLLNKSIHVKSRGFCRLKRLTLKLIVKIPKIKIISFCDSTALPHNGVRQCKARRI